MAWMPAYIAVPVPNLLSMISIVEAISRTWIPGPSAPPTGPTNPLAAALYKKELLNKT
jgi:hypothetical protein